MKEPYSIYYLPVYVERLPLERDEADGTESRKRQNPFDGRRGNHPAGALFARRTHPV